MISGCPVMAACQGDIGTVRNMIVQDNEVVVDCFGVVLWGVSRLSNLLIGGASELAWWNLWMRTCSVKGHSSGPANRSGRSFGRGCSESSAFGDLPEILPYESRI